MPDPTTLDGPRVLGALAESDPRLATYLARPRTSPTSGVDAAGRVIPLDTEEQKAQAEALGKALDEMARITDETDTDEVWKSVFRGIDEGRPHRKLFEGRS